MKRHLLMFVALMATLLCRAAVEVDGLWYDYNGRYASIVKKPDGSEYTGKITIPQYVNLSGEQVLVYNQTSAFQNSTVEEVILDIPVAKGDIYQSTLFMNFSKDADLKRVQFNKLATQEEIGYNFPNFNVGNNPECVYCYMRPGETENLVVVDNFNLYGSDGKQLKPRLVVEATGEIIYPDENNTFHLDTDWRYNGDYCMVLPLSGYYVVILAAQADDGTMTFVRTQPDRTQTGYYTTVDGINYAIVNNAVISGYDPDYNFPAEITIPESIPFAGRQYPVTEVAQGAFVGLPVEAVEFPANMATMGRYYTFIECKNLKKVDLSKTSLTELSYTFGDCPVLSDVTLPPTCTSLISVFEDCPAMKYLQIPVFATCSGLSINSGLVDVESEWIDEEHVRVTINHFGITLQDGSTPEYAAYKDWQWYAGSERKLVVYDGQKDGNSYIFNKSDFYTPNEGASDYVKNKFDSTIKIGTYEVNGTYLDSQVYANYQVPDPSGVESVEVSDADAPVQYFNLHGVTVAPDNLTPGLYIRRQGSKATKVLIR